MAKEKKKFLVTYDGGPNKKLIIGDLIIQSGGYAIFDKLPVGKEVLYNTAATEVQKLWPKEIEKQIQKRKSLKINKKPSSFKKEGTKIKYIGSQEVFTDTSGKWEKDKWVTAPNIVAKQYRQRKDFVVE